MAASRAPTIAGRSARRPVRDHLFISYAWEDAALCEWLYRKLTALGYVVWCDRFKLLAGARWPRDIDDAIKTHTFRMLAILSRDSLRKPNPSKERQLALAIARERGEDFLIPLTADRLTQTELPWELSDLNYVPFTRWDEGLRQLLDTLERSGAPRPLAQDGPDIAVASFLPPHVLRPTAERLYANCLRVIATPAVVHTYEYSRAIAHAEHRELAGRWAYERIGPTRALAFNDPPVEPLAEWSAKGIASTSWEDVSEVGGIKSFDVVASLVRKSLMVRCVELGLDRDEEGRSAFFRSGALPRDRIYYRNYHGRLTYVSVVGERKSRGGRNRYQLGLTFAPRATVGEGRTIEIKLRLRMSDPTGILDAKQANARRKQITKNWWNHEWLARQMALAAFLARGACPPVGREATEIILGAHEREQVRLAAELLTATVEPSINERLLEPLRARVEVLQAAATNDALLAEEDDADGLGDEEDDT